MLLVKKDKMMLKYYVSSLSRWNIYEASSARNALEQAEQDSHFNNLTITTVRHATNIEISNFKSFKNFEERMTKRR